MDSSKDISTETLAANSPISYSQIYEFATTKNQAIADLIKGASEETARRNLEVILSYTHIYCTESNNPIKQIASETYEWASDYTAKGIHFIANGFSQAGGQQSLLGSVLGLTLFGGGGLILGGVAGTAHALYSITNGMTLDDNQKNTVLDLLKVAEDRIAYIDQPNKNLSDRETESKKENINSNAFFNNPSNHIKRLSKSDESRLVPTIRNITPDINNYLSKSQPTLNSYRRSR